MYEETAWGWGRNTSKSIKGNTMCAHTGMGIIPVTTSQNGETHSSQGIAQKNEEEPALAVESNYLQTEHCSGTTYQIIKARPERITLFPKNLTIFQNKAQGKMYKV